MAETKWEVDKTKLPKTTSMARPWTVKKDAPVAEAPKEEPKVEETKPEPTPEAPAAEEPK